MKFHYPEFTRTPKDIDLCMYVQPHKPTEVTGNGERIEFHHNPVLADVSKFNYVVATPEELLTLKISHIFWDINWYKHMYDIQFLLKKGLWIDYRLFKDLFQFWEETHGPRQTSDLSLSKDAFFDNNLNTYDHDDLHRLLVPVPTYLHVLREGSEVEPDEMKFIHMTHSQKLELVREEVYVMAYERLGGRDYRVAYSWMLKKFIMHHAPMWEALWIIENYIELHKPIINYKEILDYELSRNPGNIKTKN